MATSLIDFNALRPNAAMESYQQGQQNQLAQMQLGQQQQAIRDAEAEREAYKGAANFGEVSQRLMKQGLGKQALAVSAAEAKQRADKIALLKDTTALMKNTATQIMANPAIAKEALVAFGQQTGTDVSRDLAQLDSYAGNADAIKQWAAGHALEADKLLPKFQHFDTGGAVQMGTVNPVSGAFTPGTTVKKTMSDYEKSRIGQENTRLAQESTSVVYQQDANGNVVALPSKLKAGEVPKARVAVAPGTGMTPLEGKPSEKVSAERISTNQQKSIIKGALDAVEKTPEAFGLARGVQGDMIGGRLATSAENEARSYVYNVVSGVIKERSGTAQSASEKSTLDKFLPSEFDNATQIKDKLNGFNRYLEDREKGTTNRVSKTDTPSATGNSVSLPDGRTMIFPDAAAAAAFKKAAGL